MAHVNRLRRLVDQLHDNQACEVQWDGCHITVTKVNGGVTIHLIGLESHAAFMKHVQDCARDQKWASDGRFTRVHRGYATRENQAERALELRNALRNSQLTWVQENLGPSDDDVYAEYLDRLYSEAKRIGELSGMPPDRRFVDSHVLSKDTAVLVSRDGHGSCHFTLYSTEAALSHTRRLATLLRHESHKVEVIATDQPLARVAELPVVMRLPAGMNSGDLGHLHDDLNCIPQYVTGFAIPLPNGCRVLLGPGLDDNEYSFFAPKAQADRGVELLRAFKSYSPYGARLLVGANDSEVTDLVNIRRMFELRWSHAEEVVLGSGVTVSVEPQVPNPRITFSSSGAPAKYVLFLATTFQSFGGDWEIFVLENEGQGVALEQASAPQALPTVAQSTPPDASAPDQGPASNAARGVLSASGIRRGMAEPASSGAIHGKTQRQAMQPLPECAWHAQYHQRSNSVG